MEGENSPRGQVIEINVDLSTTERRLGGAKTCGEAPCGFADAATNSEDFKERCASIRKLLLAVALCVVFMTIEVVGGIKANSLAIMTDAAHLLSDVSAFAISLFSLWAAGWESNPRQSYGFFRVEILSALVSIQLIWLLTGILVYEAILRLINDTGEVNGFLMLIVAAFGLFVNIIMALLLGHGDHDHGISHSHHYEEHPRSGHHHHHHHHEKENPKIENHHPHAKHFRDDEHGGIDPLLDKSKCGPEHKKQRNINVEGAYLHVLGDSIQSIGVIIGGAIVWYKPEWKIVDLACTFVFSVIVLATTIKMLRKILEVLMESTPREIDATALEQGLLEME